ncbi:hypothetical protein QO006_002681 [Deinococcus enclensis]|uniref:Uncharacterized protein n=1 Tax=Deinococcus enclensis TaxID=1049582 RepID=A0ABT9MF59_9DEIO|nr:hypothetical protein [Deinococcus enclensis]
MILTALLLALSAALHRTAPRAPRPVPIPVRDRR